MQDTPFVSVIIPTYNRKEMLKECLESIFIQTYPKDKYEIIVVNDGSTDGTESLANEYEKKAPCKLKWFNLKHGGTSSALNFGIENSLGEIVCITGDDCIADNDWIKNMVNCFSDEKIGGVGGRIIGYKPVTLAQKFAEKSKFFDQERMINIFIVGGNSAYRKNILKTVGGFTGIIGCEDVDVGIRVRLEGFTLKYCPQGIIYHKHRATLGGLIRQLYGYGVGYAYLHKKYIKNFNPALRIRNLSFRLLRKIILAPFKILRAFFGEEKKFYLAEPFLEILALSSMVLGIIKESYFGKKYTGEVIDEKLEFIERAKLPDGWGL